ncbi:hypothetical protein K502DRAFT_361693 [Neoconidiobolus thromboides FSU 785]|nr:hypothetical protein K502DRAFT_361693 [Neoconidiobolus thromboides FSU 785]
MSATAQNALLNVLRWGALSGGLFYGYNRHNSLVKLEAKLQAENEYKRKEKLIHDAKVAYAQKKAAQGSSVVSDPDSPNFDLEKFLLSFEKTN